MAPEESTRDLELSLDEFASATLAELAAQAGVPRDRLVGQAARHWLAVREDERLSARTPGFRQASAPADTRVRPELDSSEWDALERSAADQGFSVEQLLVHAILLLLADLDSGRLALEIARDEQQGQEETG